MTTPTTQSTTAPEPSGPPETAATEPTAPGTPGTADRPAQEPSAPGQTPPEGDPSAASPEESTDPGREAARYRRRLRETEGERDALAQRVDRMHRAEVERLAADALAQPADVLTFGADLSELLDDEGDVSPDMVRLAVGVVLSQRPGLARPEPRRPLDLGAGRRGVTVGTEPSWSEALRGRNG